MSRPSLRAVFLFFPLSSVLLHAQIAAPAAGYVRFSGQTGIRSVLGVAGSFVTGPAALGAAEAASFGEKAALLATSGVLRLVRNDGKLLASFAYSGPTPVLEISDGPPSALAWLPEAHSLLTFDGRQFVASALLPGDLPGTVTSVSLLSPQWANLLLLQADGSVSQALVELADGDVRSIDLLPGIEGPAYRFGTILLWRDAGGLQSEDVRNGERHTLAAPEGPFSAERMSGQWMHLFFARNNTHWALQLGKGEPVLSRLPVPAAGVAR